MNKNITGIHHITGIAGDVQKNVDFYTGILGMRMVKKTVNFDDPGTYHFYYADEKGTPGSVLTFFPYPGAYNGRHGKGMLNTTTFSVPLSSLNYWLDRLKRFEVEHKGPVDRFAGETVVYFEDADGVGLEFIFNEKDERPGFDWGIIPRQHAIKGFYSAEVWEEGYEKTAGLLTGLLDHTLIAEKGNRFRFATEDKPGHYLDILCMPDSLRGLGGSGTIHHIAFAAPDEAKQLEIHKKIISSELNVSPVLDRKYFKSIYFREPGGVLFEVATQGPGFMVDESYERLGEDLNLPDQFEQDRKKIEEKLAPVTVSPYKFK